MALCNIYLSPVMDLLDQIKTLATLDRSSLRDTSSCASVDLDFLWLVAVQEGMLYHKSVL